MAIDDRSSLRPHAPRGRRGLLALSACLALACGGGTTTPDGTTPGDAGPPPGATCALPLDACARDRDCCEGRCQAGACALCRASGRPCASSAGCCSGRCLSFSGTCR